MVWWQPLALASAAFAASHRSDDIGAKRIGHWQAIVRCRMAARDSTFMPFCTLKVRLSRYSTVIPLSIIPAACSYEMPAGNGTTRSAGMSRSAA